MQSYLRLIRPKQWIKNFFVFIPAFFGGDLFDTAVLADTLVVFAAFCFVASSIYCLNDIADVDDDRRHPVKCKRPIASGAVSVRTGWALMAACAALGMAVPAAAAGALGPQMWRALAVVAAYWVLNIAYCVWLKHHAIIDVCIVATGFVLRIVAAGEATDIPLSVWVVLMTFLLTLFLSFCKRRDDVLRMMRTGVAPRENTVRYNLTFINQAVTITAAVLLVCYIMYTVSPEVRTRAMSGYAYLTTILVIVGLLRYIQLAVVDEKSGDPVVVVLHDRFTQVIVAAWIAAYWALIYVI